MADNPYEVNTPTLDINGVVNQASALQQLKQQRAQFQANQALTDAYKQSTDPTTGQTDYNKLTALASQSGAGAYLPDFMNKVLDTQNKQIGAASSKLDLAQKQQTIIRSTIGSILSDPSVGQRDASDMIKSRIIDGIKSGVIPMNQGISEIQQIPTQPAAQKQWLTNHFVAALSGEAQLKAMMPTTQVINSGGSQHVVAINPMTGQPTETGTIQNSMAPGEAATPVNVIGPNGEPRAVTKQQFAGMADGGIPQGYTGRPGGGGGGAGGGMLPGIPGAEPGAVGVQTGRTPEQEAAYTAANAGAGVDAQTSAQAAADLSKATADAPIRIGYLKDAQQALNSIQTGPGTDFRNNLASMLQSTPALGSALQAMGITNPEDIKNYDELKKIMYNYANSASASAGTGTNDRLNVAISGNANPNISKLANQDILPKMIAAEQYRAAQNDAFQNSGARPEQFKTWQAQWNKEVDPATFAYANMNQSQRQAFQEREKKSGNWDNFKRQYVALVAQKYIQPANGGQ